jgi:hypothetical protein
MIFTLFLWINSPSFARATNSDSDDPFEKEMTDQWTDNTVDNHDNPMEIQNTLKEMNTNGAFLDNIPHVASAQNEKYTFTFIRIK